MELLLVALLHLATSVVSLKLTNMTIPLVADTRSKMELNCRFDMENEELYAVKWYKDDQEFFRYTPHQQPHKQTFNVPGVRLEPDDWDCSFSHCRLVLSNPLRPYSSGAYRCEISTEAPTFRLASETKNVTVATLPKSGPIIEGLRNYYVEGDLITANCTTNPSEPAPILTWRKNNQEAHQLTRYNDISDPDGDGLVSRSATIVFQAERKQKSLASETIELRCESTLPGVPLPPKTTVKSIEIRSSEHEQNIRNQKLHWFNTSSGTLFNYCPVLYISICMSICAMEFLSRPT